MSELANCKVEHEKQFSELKVELQSVKDKCDNLAARLDGDEANFAEIKEMAVTLATMAVTLQQVSDAVLAQKEELEMKINKLDERILALENKPIKRWDRAVEDSIAAGLGAIVTYIVSHFI